jgi:hypothetical protein
VTRVDWAAIESAFGAVQALSTFPFWIGVFSYPVWTMFRRGTWQRAVFKKVYEVCLPIILFHYAISVLLSVIQDRWGSAGWWAFGFAVWVFNYWAFQKFHKDDDDDFWTKLGAKVKNRLRRRRATQIAWSGV